MTESEQGNSDLSAETDAGIKQSREIAEKVDHWLDLFDSELAGQDLALSHRPLQALMMLFREGAIAVRAGDERLDDPENLGESFDKIWFRVLFDAVEYWYVERYGAPAMEAKGNADLVGVQMIRSVPFAISIPANRTVVEEKGESAWMYFEDGLAEGEDVTSWIVDSPDLSALASEAKETAVAEATRTAEVLRSIEFRRVTFRSSGDHEVQKLIQSTLTYLCQAASRIVSSRRSELGPAWFDLQMANEAALKAVIRSSTGKQPHVHSLDDLLARAQKHGVVFEGSRLSSWPRFSKLSDWRYGQGQPPGTAAIYSAYQLSLELIEACMAQITPGMAAGFGILLRYSPWRTKNALGEFRESDNLF